jgi:hypothetical protein
MTGMQKLFNKAVRAIRKQGQPSVNEYGICSYRGINGNRCIFGWLIPNKMYNKKMEYRSASILLMEFPKLKNHLKRMYGDIDSDFFNELQLIHDSALVHWGMKDFENDVQKFANKYSLDVPK